MDWFKNALKKFFSIEFKFNSDEMIIIQHYLDYIHTYTTLNPASLEAYLKCLIYFKRWLYTMYGNGALISATEAGLMMLASLTVAAKMAGESVFTKDIIPYATKATLNELMIKERELLNTLEFNLHIHNPEDMMINVIKQYCQSDDLDELKKNYLTEMLREEDFDTTLFQKKFNLLLKSQVHRTVNLKKLQSLVKLRKTGLRLFADTDIPAKKKETWIAQYCNNIYSDEIKPLITDSEELFFLGRLLFTLPIKNQHALIDPIRKFFDTNTAFDKWARAIRNPSALAMIINCSHKDDWDSINSMFFFNYDYIISDKNDLENFLSALLPENIGFIKKLPVLLLESYIGFKSFAQNETVLSILIDKIEPSENFIFANNMLYTLLYLYCHHHSSLQTDTSFVGRITLFFSSIFDYNASHHLAAANALLYVIENQLNLDTIPSNYKNALEQRLLKKMTSIYENICNAKHGGEALTHLLSR